MQFVIVVFSFCVIGMTLAQSKPKKSPSAHCPGKKIQTTKQFTPRSCLDYLRNGYESSGYYKIYMADSKTSFPVYCDMCSETGAAWTLVESFALKNAKMWEFGRTHLSQNRPVNENSPNWNIYRMSIFQMDSVRAQATHWRATCSFPTHGVDYIDYVRAKFAEFDILKFSSRKGVCKKVEFIHIRGHVCTQCTSQWYAVGPRIESRSTGCQFKPTKGSVNNENNFGHYWFPNKKFRCTSSPTSTTNWWFGGYQ